MDNNPCERNPAPLSRESTDYLQGVGGGLLPTVEYESVLVSNNTPDITVEDEQISVSMRMFFRQQVRGDDTLRWYDDIDYVSYLRLRIVGCFEPQAASDLDYISQRFLNYQEGGFSEAFLGDNAPEDGEMDQAGNAYVYGLERAGGERIKNILSRGGPFSSTDLLNWFKGTNNQIYPYRDNLDLVGPQEQAQVLQAILDKTIVYDSPVQDLLIKETYTDENGNTNLRVKRQRVADVVSQNQSGDIYDIEKSPLAPINFILGAGDLRTFQNIQQMSFYAYVYFDYGLFCERMNRQDLRPDDYNWEALQTGMGYVNSACLLGTKSTYVDQINAGAILRGPRVVDGRQEEITYMVAEGMEGRQLQTAPQARVLQDSRSYQPIKVEDINQRLFLTLHESLKRSFVDSALIDDIKDRNHFSPMWAGINENAQVSYSFAFDLRAFLVENSRFPMLYLIPEVYDDLIERQYDVENGTYFTFSEILDVIITRTEVEFEGKENNNILGTTLSLRKIKPSHTYPPVRVASPQSLPIRVQGTDAFFYQGVDNLNKDVITQNLSRYQYSARVLVKDGSADYLLKGAAALNDASQRVLDIFNMVVNSPVRRSVRNIGVGQGNTKEYYDPITQTVVVPLSRMRLLGGRDAESLIRAQVQTYVNWVNKLGVIQQSDLSEGLLSTSLMALANSPNPEGLRTLSETIRLLAKNLEKLVGKEFSGEAYDDDQDLSHSKLESRGFCQRKFVILESHRSFNEIVEFGRQFKTGYKYITPSALVPVGLGLPRVTRTDYIQRCTSEFLKYFDFKPGSVAAPERLRAPFVEGYANSSCRYFTPHFVETFEKASVNQMAYKVQNSPSTNYDLNRYGELFSDIIKLQKNTKFLGIPYYNLIDEQANDTANSKLYNSLRNILRDESCVISDGFNEQFAPPAPSNVFSFEFPPVMNFNFDLPSWEARVEIEGESIFPLILGGEADRTTQTIDFVNNLDSNLRLDAETNLDPMEQFQELDIDIRSTEHPIKLAFSVAGEMKLVPEIRSGNYGVRQSYESLSFNSMTKMALLAGLGDYNLRDVLEDRFANLPNQWKSMMVTSIIEGGSDLGNGFDAVRDQLAQTDDATPEESQVTYIARSSQFPPYQKTRDPMKIYAKFLAFWMNYKQLATVEYLDSFDGLSATMYLDYLSNASQQANNPFLTKAGLPIWRKFTFDSFNDLQNTNLLCRVRPISSVDLNDVPVSARNYEILNIDHKELFSLPIFNQYFLLVGSSENITLESLDIDTDAIIIPDEVPLPPTEVPDVSVEVPPSAVSAVPPGSLTPTTPLGVNVDAVVTPALDMGTAVQTLGGRPSVLTSTQGAAANFSRTGQQGVSQRGAMNNRSGIGDY